jgi:hypothetical protein
MRMGKFYTNLALFSAAAIFMANASVAPAAQVLYNSNGFEASAGYVANLPLTGQPAAATPANQWTQASQGLTNPGYPAAEVITYAPPNQTQQLVGVADNNIGASDYGYWYPQANLPPLGTAFTPSSGNGTNFINVAWTEAWLAGATGNPFFGIAVQNGPNIVALGGVDATTGAAVDENPTSTNELGSAFFQGTAGTYYNFNLLLNYTAQTYTFSVNGTPIDTQPFVNAATQFTDADITTYVLGTTGANGDGYFDNYIVTAVPEPGILTIGGLGVFLLSVRKPRRSAR